ncbi:MAG: lysophospholipase [Mailhella sp.]|nr:lysophospholipase [Mailhella sp.]
MAEMFEQGVIRTNDGLNLFYRRDIPRRPKGIVVLLHSLAEHSGRYDEVALRLNKAGYGVYRFDCRGHGRSDGPRGDVQNFHDYVQDTDVVVDRARRENPESPVFLVGQSMGGFVAAAYAAEHPGKLAGEVTVGAAVRRMPALDFLDDERRHRLRERGDERFSLMLPYWKDRGYDSWSSDRLILDSVTVRLAGNVWLYGADWFAPRMKDVVTPLFILHGEDDELVPSETAKWFYDGVSSQDRTLRTYPHLANGMLERDGDILGDIVAWLDTHRGRAE